MAETTETKLTQDELALLNRFLKRLAEEAYKCINPNIVVITGCAISLIALNAIAPRSVAEWSNLAWIAIAVLLVMNTMSYKHTSQQQCEVIELASDIHPETRESLKVASQEMAEEVTTHFNNGQLGAIVLYTASFILFLTYRTPLQALIFCYLAAHIFYLYTLWKIKNRSEKINDRLDRLALVNVLGPVEKRKRSSSQRLMLNEEGELAENDEPQSLGDLLDRQQGRKR